MAVLSNNDRAAMMRKFAQDMSSTRTAMSIVKADLRAAVNAIDDWVDTNASAFNTAIPQPARGALTTQQKAKLLWYVVQRRFEVS